MFKYYDSNKDAFLDETCCQIIIRGNQSYVSHTSCQFRLPHTRIPQSRGDTCDPYNRIAEHSLRQMFHARMLTREGNRKENEVNRKGASKIKTIKTSNYYIYHIKCGKLNGEQNTTTPHYQFEISILLYLYYYYGRLYRDIFRCF